MAFENLVVINLPVATNELSWPGKEQWFLPESCMRHLLVGPKEAMATLPASIARHEKTTPALSHSSNTIDASQTMIFKGQDAYEFLLRFACGLESKNAGEYFVVHDLKKDWDKYQREHDGASYVRSLMKDMEHVLADAKLIRHHIYMGDLRPTRYGISAAALAGVKKGDRVVLVAGENDFTKQVARDLGRDNSNCIGHLMVTHPDPDILQKRSSVLMALKECRLIACPVESLPYREALSSCFSDANHLFVCTPLSARLEAEHRDLKNAWQGKTRKQGSVVLLNGGHPAVTSLWREGNSTHCVFPPAIASRFEDDKKQNQQILLRAARACHMAATARQKGLTTGKISYIFQHHRDGTPEAQVQVMEEMKGYQDWTRAVKEPMDEIGARRELRRGERAQMRACIKSEGPEPSGSWGRRP